MLVGLMMEECSYFVCFEKYHDRASNFDEDPNASILQGNGPFPLGFDVFKVQPISSLTLSMHTFGPEGNVYGQAASNLVAESTLRSIVQQLINMGGDCLDWDVVILAFSLSLSMLLLKVSQAHVGQCVFPAPALTTIPTPTPAPAPAPAAPTPFPVLSVLSNFFFLFYSLITLIPCRLCLEENVYGQIVLNLILGSTLGSTAQQIIGMGGGSCYWCTVICALPSAHNNLPWLESPRLITEPVGGECLSRNISGQLAGIMPQAVTLTPEKIQAIKRVNKKEILIETMPILKSYKYQPMLLELLKQNPNFMHLIQEHQAYFDQ
ncbi:hypothetical protein LguiB_033004 [Lonicera macranthoides]